MTSRRTEAVDGRQGAELAPEASQAPENTPRAATGAAVAPRGASEANANPATVPEPIVQTTKYTVNCLPEDGFDSHVFALTVEYRGNGRWGVFRGQHCCLGADGTWSWGYGWNDGAEEPATDEEWDDYHRGREEWLNAHRFDEKTALQLAKEQAPLVTVNGYTVTDALRMAEKRAARE